MATVLTKSFPQEKPPFAKTLPGKKRVLIVGGGFSGIAAARALKRANVKITLIDRRNHHIFQPLLYQVATAVLAPAEIAAPLRQLEAKQTNLSVLLAEVKGIDPGAPTVEAILPRNWQSRNGVRFPRDRRWNAAELLRSRRVRAVRARPQEPQRR
ncbi:FAD-dependent oxidoreductase [Bradyrhizobium sp. AZCC 2289]|uniref:FAD-dependent oxidoreductase n=1 Tax=Bradyrhizobium sp. AZCC 2289 TaxID=3117026 RepID=UPI002FEFD73F